MSLIFAEGFDWLRTLVNDGLMKYDTLSSPTGGPTYATHFIPGRFGGFAFRSESHDWTWGTKDMGSNDIFTVGIAIRFSNPSDKYLIRMTDASHSDQISLYLRRYKDTDDGYLELVSGQNSLGISAPLAADEWHYIEWSCKIHTTLGLFEVRINEAPVFDDSSIPGTVNTAATGSDNANRVRFQATTRNGPGDYCEIDDVYITDNNGPPNTAFLGDIVCEALTVDDEGNQTTWTPSSGNTHYTLVDNLIAPEGDGAYVASDTITIREQFKIKEPIVVTGDIAGVFVEMYARLISADTRQLAAVLRSGGLNFDSDLIEITSTSYTMHSHGFGTNENTGQPFTFADIVNLEIGIRLIT